MKVINRRWFSIKAAVDAAEISIFDEIGGWGVSVADFQKEFSAVRGAKSITLLLNSPGGNVFDGMALYNILATERERLTVRVVGVAASIASVIALAGRELVMAEATYLMIHNPWAVAVGPAEEMRKTADLLDSVAQQLVGIYAAHSSLTPEEIGKLMADETWMTAEEAMVAGFAKIVEEGAAVAALGFGFEKYGYKRTPDGVLARSHQEARPPQSVREFEDFLREVGGFDRTAAKRIVAHGFTSSRDAAGDGAGCVDRVQASVLQEKLRKVQLRI